MKAANKQTVENLIHMAAGITGLSPEQVRKEWAQFKISRDGASYDFKSAVCGWLTEKAGAK